MNYTDIVFETEALRAPVRAETPAKYRARAWAQAISTCGGEARARQLFPKLAPTIEAPVQQPEPIAISGAAEGAELLDFVGDLLDETPADADVDEVVVELEAREATPAPVVAAEPVVIPSLPINRVLPDIAPAFRLQSSMANPNTGRAYSGDEAIALIDRQIADLKYLHSRGHRAVIDSPKYRAMLASDVLDLALAQEFAREQWKPDHKAKLLRVGLALQLELGYFRTKPIKDKVRSAQASVADARLVLEDAVGADTRIDLDVWCSVLLCSKLVGAGKPSAVAALYQKMTGHVGDRRVIDRTLKRINAHLKG